MNQSVWQFGQGQGMTKKKLIMKELYEACEGFEVRAHVEVEGTV